MAVARLKNFDPFTAKHLQTYRLFCLHGENDALIRERVASLRTAFSATGPAPSVIDVDGDALSREPFALADEIGSMSLFAERRFLRVTLGARAAEDAFVNALPLLATADGVLISVDAGTDKRQDDTIRLLSGNADCLVVPCPLDAIDDLADHARSVLAKVGITLEEAASRELVDLTDGDRALLSNELTKLILLTERGGTIGTAAMRSAVADEAGTLLDDVAEQILAGKVAAAVDATDRLAGAGADAAQLVGATLRKALWNHRNASGGKAQDLRRVIARLNESVLASRSNDKLADNRAQAVLIKTAQFLRR